MKEKIFDRVMCVCIAVPTFALVIGFVYCLILTTA